MLSTGNPSSMRLDSAAICLRLRTPAAADEQVAEKKRKAADAAAAATEGGKPAENGTATEAN